MKKSYLFAAILGLVLAGACSPPVTTETDDVSTTEQAFVALCQSNQYQWDPYAGSMPAPQNPPTVGAQLPQEYKCSWYPDPVTFGPMNVSQYVSECTPPTLINGSWIYPPTPQGSVDIWDGFNVHQGKCARVTPPTHNGTWVYRPYFDFLGNGWRTRVWNGTGYGEFSIHSIEVGPHTHVKFSSNARVDLTTNWACILLSGGSKCRDIDNQAAWSLEADHFHLHSTLEGGWAPWSMMISANY